MTALKTANYLAQLLEAEFIRQEHFDHVSTLMHQDVEQARATIPGAITIALAPETYSRHQAVSKVLNTTELLEQILTFVPSHDLRISIPRVCRGFWSTLNASIRLQRRLMFVADQNCDKLWFTYVPSIRDKTHIRAFTEAAGLSRSREYGFSYDRRWDTDKFINSWHAYDGQDQTTDACRPWRLKGSQLKIVVDLPFEELRNRISRSQGSSRRALICQPPITYLHSQWSFGRGRPYFELDYDKVVSDVPLPTLCRQSGLTYGDILDAMAQKLGDWKAVGIEVEGRYPIFEFVGTWD